MAQIKYNSSNYNNKSKPVYKVGFFPTLQDGEEILVRFPYAKGEEFHTVTTHTLKVNGIFRHISCPEDNCPLCAKEKAKETIFIKVLIYKTEGETVTPTAVVWARPKLFGKDIEDALTSAFEYNLAQEGSALEDVVFKIKRTGTAKNTKYSVKPAKLMYQSSELYGKKFDNFKDLRIGGIFYLEKSSEDISYFLTNGSFPSKYNNSTNNEVETNTKPNDDAFGSAPVTKVEAVKAVAAPKSVMSINDVEYDNPLADTPLADTPKAPVVNTPKPTTTVATTNTDRPYRKYAFDKTRK